MVKITKCKWCGEESVDVLLHYEDIKLSLFKCRSCHVFFNGADHELLDYASYNKTLTKLNSNDPDSKLQIQRRLMETKHLAGRVDDVCKERLLDGCSFMDVGCGPGDLVAHLSKKYKNSIITGLDPSKYNVQEAKDKYNVDLVEGYWHEYDSEKFDVITIFGNLMLHENPKETLIKAYNYLNKDGILIFDVKNPENATRDFLLKFDKFLPRAKKINQFYWHAFHGMLGVCQKKSCKLFWMI